jgi:Protein of unknown function (DUF1116)
MSTLPQNLQVVNVGVRSFAESILAVGGLVTQVDWRPPADSDNVLGRTLAHLINHPQIEAANRTASDGFFAAQPVIADVKPAQELIPDLADRVLLHAGPPIVWERMCGPMQGAIVGAILFEGWANDPDGAAELAASGEIAFAPCHHYRAVGPMAGIVSASMPVWSVINAAGKNQAFSGLNEGLGKVLRFGAYSSEVLEHLKWMSASLGPMLGAALRATGGIELKPLMAQSLQMGDELHNRNIAASSLLLKNLIDGLLQSDQPSSAIARAVRFIASNAHFFLNISMAACKVMLDAAHGIANSSLITVMARNGTDFGVRMSGTGDRWFTAPAPIVKGLYFPSYGPDDASRDLGDSAITETAGFGAFAMAAAPAIVKFVGGTRADAEANTRLMRRITAGPHPYFTIPSLDFSGIPSLIDARKVVDRSIVPIINTGIAHRAPGIGQVGAGISHAPMGCFVLAIRALREARITSPE